MQRLRAGAKVKASPATNVELISDFSATTGEGADTHVPFLYRQADFCLGYRLDAHVGGALAVISLPVNQYPNIAPPAVQITVTYPGASAQTVQDTVVQVIEQQLNGLDGLRYISSSSNTDGSMQIIVTFDQGTDPDIAQVQVQNKLQLATPMLPEEVQRQGIRVVKYQVNFMLILGLVSTDGRMSDFDMGNLIVANLQDPISRTKGSATF